MGACRSAYPSFRLAFVVTSARRADLRLLQTTASRTAPNATTPSLENASASPAPSEGVKEEKFYYGPLAQTFRRLKIFSMSTLALSTIMTPFIFIIETASAVPFIGRLALASTVLATSSISTALVAWTGKPYVHTLRWLPPEETGQAAGAAEKRPTGIELATYTFALHERKTRVYDTAFLVPTSRPFAKWELATTFQLPPDEAAAEKRKGLLPREETIAETIDTYRNEVVGRWIVRWAEDGTGTCHPVGKILR